MIHLTDNEFLALKIADYETIPYSVSLECPNECSDAFGLHNEQSVLIGCCETPNGFMRIYECPVCFTKFRFHGSMFHKTDIDDFRQNFELTYFLQNDKSRL